MEAVNLGDRDAGHCLRCPGRLEFTDIAEPVRQPGQVLVKMRRMGICGTDMHIYGGRQPFFEYPRIIGHS